MVICKKENKGKRVSIIKNEIRKMVKDIKESQLFLLELSFVFVLNRNSELLYCTKQPNPMDKAEKELFTLDMQTSEPCYSNVSYFNFSMCYIWFYCDVVGYLVMLYRESKIGKKTIDVKNVGDQIFLPKYKYWKVVY